MKKVFPELRKRAKERFVEILEVDLRWGITEEQSKSGETLRICLEEIDRCRPSAPVFFVGLLGERYGWIPPQDYFNKDVLEDPNLGRVRDHLNGKSVTACIPAHPKNLRVPPTRPPNNSSKNRRGTQSTSGPNVL